MRAAILALAASSLLASTSAVAAPAMSASDSDARCLLAMAALSSSQDAATARSAQIGVIYFVGRLRAHEPTADLTARLKPVAATLTGQSLKPEIERCGPMVQTAMSQLEGALRALSPPAPAAQGKPATPAPAPAPKKP